MYLMQLCRRSELGTPQRTSPYALSALYTTSELCSNTLSFVIYLAESLETDAERAALAERAMRASRKNGDISDTGAAADRAEVVARLGPFYII